MSKSHDSKENLVIDHFILGAGMGGTYLSARLQMQFPNDSIFLVDKLDNYGGLMTAVKVPDQDDTVDLGPIRFYPALHPRVAWFSQNVYPIRLVDYLPAKQSNTATWYLRDKSYPLSSVGNPFVATEDRYFLNPDELGKVPFGLLQDNIVAYLAPHPLDELFPLATRIPLYADAKYSNVVFQTAVQDNVNVISQENWQRMMDILGYGDLLSTKTNFIVNAHESVSLAGQDQQYRFQDGYHSLPIAMAKANNFKTIDDFRKLKPCSFKKNKVRVSFHTVALNVRFSKSKQLWRIKLGYFPNIINPENAIYMNPLYTRIVYAKKFYSTIYLSQLISVYPEINTFQKNYYQTEFVNFDIMRVYFEYSEDWMTNIGFGMAKSVTTLPGGQIIHYGDRLLLFYIFRAQCSKVFGLIPDNMTIQKQFIVPDPDTQPMIDELTSILTNTFQTAIPQPERLCWASWVAPIKTMIGRNPITLSGESGKETIDNIMFPYGKDGNFYVLNNSASFLTAWVEGSIELGDYFMNQMYGTPLDAYKTVP